MEYVKTNSWFNLFVSLLTFGASEMSIIKISEKYQEKFVTFSNL